jgi:serine/threonine protein phosphatase PrpC
MSVADGAGSSRYSRRGAELASWHSTHRLQQMLNEQNSAQLENAFWDWRQNNDESHQRRLQDCFRHTIVKAVYDATRAIAEEVKKEEVKKNGDNDSFSDYSTTLLLAAIKPIPKGYLVLSFWIGDGVAAIYRQGEGIMLLGSPDTGEYAGQTRFLNQSIFEDGSVYARVAMMQVDQMTAVILATDGISDAYFDTTRKLSEIQPWDKLWAELEPIVASPDLIAAENKLSEWMDFWSPGNHDDRSIAICYPKG